MQQTDIDPIKKMADSARAVVNHLQEVDAQNKADSLANAISNNYVNSKLIIVNGLKAFYAYKDEMLLQYAVKFNVRYPKLLEMNDLPDAPLAFNTYVYVEKKLASGTHTHHAVKEGENLLMIAQAESMQLKRLQALNLMQPNEEPATGVILSLQFPARAKPNLAVKMAEMPKPVVIPESAIHAPVAKATVPAEKEHSSPGVIDNKDEVSDTEEEVDTLESAKEDVKAGVKPGKDNAVHRDDRKEITGETADVPPQSKPLAATSASKGKDKYYTVKKGDTAFSIAKRNNVPLDQLMEWNDISDGGIKVGQTLRVKE